MHNFIKSSDVDLVPGGDSGVRGTVTLFQGPGYVRIYGTIFGLTPGPHGFHIHMNGDVGDNCKAAGGHFNPDSVRRSLNTIINLTKLLCRMITLLQLQLCVMLEISETFLHQKTFQ